MAYSSRVKACSAGTIWENQGYRSGTTCFRIYMIHVVLEVSIGPELDVCRNYMASRSGTALVPDLAATDPSCQELHHKHQFWGLATFEWAKNGQVPL